IESDDAMPLSPWLQLLRGERADEPFLPGERPRRHDAARQVAADDAGAGARFVNERRVVEIRRRQDAVHGAAYAQPTDQGAGVDALDADNAMLGEIGIERLVRAKVAWNARQLANDEPFDLRGARLAILGVDAVVADERIGHRHDLSLVRRIGED